MKIARNKEGLIQITCTAVELSRFNETRMFGTDAEEVITDFKERNTDPQLRRVDNTNDIVLDIDDLGVIEFT